MKSKKRHIDHEQAPTLAHLFDERTTRSPDGLAYQQHCDGAWQSHAWSAVRQRVADWQAASGHDANSAYGDPLFVDIDGADGVLGYTSAGDGYDGPVIVKSDLNCADFPRDGNGGPPGCGASWSAAGDLTP